MLHAGANKSLHFKAVMSQRLLTGPNLLPNRSGLLENWILL